jgi:uracil-DNA glycosylase family 4
MSPDAWKAVRELTLSTLTDINALTTAELAELNKALNLKESSGTDSGIRGARLLLLQKVVEKAGQCTACERYQQRVNPCVAEGALDGPFLLADYPGYVDTMAGRPMTGSPEVLLTKCGTCSRLEEHFLPALHPAEQEKLVPVPGSCRYEPRFDGKVILLPQMFQNLDNSLQPVGSGGQVLDRLLVDLGEKRFQWDGKSTVYITSSLLCPAIETDTGLTRPSRVKERSACAPWLDLQIAIVDPCVIICLGKEAMHRFLSSKTYPKLATEVGRLLRQRGRLIGITWHPTMVLRNIDGPDSGKYYGELLEHLKHFIAVGRGQESDESVGVDASVPSLEETVPVP